MDRPIDGPAFLNELATTVDPIVKSVAGVFAEKVDAVTLALYSVTLELFSRRNARFPGQVFHRAIRLAANSPDDSKTHRAQPGTPGRLRHQCR